MSNKAFISIQGLYNYDNNLFANLVLPTGVDADMVVQQITMECSDLELIYPDFNVMKTLIGQWSQVELPIWEKYYQAQTIEFNPLYNVDAYEIDTEERDLKNTNELSSTGNANDMNSATAYNDGSMVNREKNTSDSTSNSSGSGTDTGTITHTIRRYGNIGVTKSTELLEDYKEYIESTNIYKYITDSFMKRFCLMIY